jgi:hypothetical protein
LEARSQYEFSLSTLDSFNPCMLCQMLKAANDLRTGHTFKSSGTYW